MCVSHVGVVSKAGVWNTIAKHVVCSCFWLISVMLLGGLVRHLLLLARQGMQVLAPHPGAES